MKCPHCWSEKAFVLPPENWKRNLLSWLLFVPLKCHHCYHTFTVSWFSTLGQQLDPPEQPRINPEMLSQKPSRAAMYWAERQESAAEQAASGTASANEQASAGESR